MTSNADGYAGHVIDEQRRALAEEITRRHYAAVPELSRRYGTAGRKRCTEDAEFHLAHLSDAMAASHPVLFADYIAWAKIMLAGRGIPVENLVGNLRLMRDVLADSLPPEAGLQAASYVAAALEGLPHAPSSLPPLLLEDAPLGSLARDYLSALLRCERHIASRLILGAAETGTAVRDLYIHVFQRCQREVGRLWQMNLITVAQEHYCTAATQLVMSQLYPYVFAGAKDGRKLVVACVAGDLHELGARVVSDLLEMEGWDTVYLGADVPSESIVKTLQDRQADVLALSATMTFHVRAVTALIADIRGSPIGSQVKIMVGGYPFNLVPDLWRRVGADAWARDALEAIAVAGRLTERAP